MPGLRHGGCYSTGRIGCRARSAAAWHSPSPPRSPRLCRGDTDAGGAACGRGAPTCAGRWESTGTHIRRGVPDGRSGAPRFFYRDPAIPLPARDSRVIALDGATLGFLARPAERGEQPAHMSAVQAHAEGAVDDGGNTSGGPEVGVEIPARGTPQQKAGELPLLRGRQLRWTTRRRFRRQGLEAAPTHRLAPEDHRTVRTPEPAGHLRDRCARLQQLNPAPSPSPQLLGASLGSHAPRISRETSDVYYLRTHQ